VVVAGGGQPARHQDQDLGGEPLHLVEDVAGHEHGHPGRADQPDELDEAGPLPRVHPGHWLVQDQQGRLVDDGPGHLGPLALTLGEALEAPVGQRGHVDLGDGPLGGRAGVGHPLELGVQPHVRADGEPRVQPVPVGDDPDGPVQHRVAQDGPPEQQHLALGGVQQPADGLEGGGLAGPVGPQQPGDPGPQLERQVGHSDHVPVPLGEPPQLDHCRPGRPRRRLGAHARRRRTRQVRMAAAAAATTVIASR
jgi:hypothetical protein